MTAEQKKAALAMAWADYRAGAALLNANPKLGWSEHLDADERLWRRYRETERQILAEPAASRAA